MSLVGPRPPLAREVAGLREQRAPPSVHQAGPHRHVADNGRRDLSWEESVRLDLYYVENWSLTGDLMIMWRTVRVLTRTRGGLLTIVCYRTAPLRIAMVGTRGVPAAVRRVRDRRRGDRPATRRPRHDVTVYCRADGPHAPRDLGMQLVHLPALRRKVARDAQPHGALGRCTPVRHAGRTWRSCSTPRTRRFVPLLRARGIPVATHVDGLEWQRAKWGGAGRRYYRSPSSWPCGGADALIADAQGIADYYADEFGVPTRAASPTARPCVEPAVGPAGRARPRARRVPPRRRALRAGEPRRRHRRRATPRRERAPAARRRRLGAVRRRVHRRASSSAWPTRASGSSAGCGTRSCSTSSTRTRCTYLHGHSVGGTNPSLLRAMGAGDRHARLRQRLQPRGAGRRRPLLVRRRGRRRASSRARRPRPTRPPRSAPACRSAPRRPTTGTRSPTATRSSPPA